jgi:hypothetical protein
MFLRIYCQKIMAALGLCTFSSMKDGSFRAYYCMVICILCTPGNTVFIMSQLSTKIHDIIVNLP